MSTYIKTVNLTNANEGYQLSSLLSGILPADHRVQYLRLWVATSAWIVPASGGYSQTAGTPDDNGGNISSSGLVIDAGAPIIDLDDIFLGAATANQKVSILAFR